MVEIRHKRTRDVILVTVEANSLAGIRFSEDVHLRGADLRQHNLRGANFGSRDLTGALLDGATLCEADLTEVTGLRDASLKEAVYSDVTRWPTGFDPVEAGAILVEE